MVYPKTQYYAQSCSTASLTICNLEDTTSLRGVAGAPECHGRSRGTQQAGEMGQWEPLAVPRGEALSPASGKE